MTYQIIISKERHKFSAAHMTFFPNGTKEKLHGHNYQVTLFLTLKKIDFKNMVPFSAVKGSLSRLCDQWDEKVLLPKKQPFLKVINKTAKEIEWVACKKRYVLPADEIAWLDTDNVTIESLSEVLALKLKEIIKKEKFKNIVTLMRVEVAETLGQKAATEIAMGAGP